MRSIAGPGPFDRSLADLVVSLCFLMKMFGRLRFERKRQTKGGHGEEKKNNEEKENGDGAGGRRRRRRRMRGRRGRRRKKGE